MNKTILSTLTALVALPLLSFVQHKKADDWIDFNKNGKKDVYEDKHAKIEDRVEDLLGQMNVAEKTCQLTTLYGYGAFLKDHLPTASWKDSVWKDGIANIDEQLTGYRKDTSYASPYSAHATAINTIQKWFIEETRLGIPVDFTTEGIRGLNHMRATYYPSQLAQGNSFNKNLVYRIGQVTGREAKALGYTNVYSPILDVSSDPRWGRVEETYGSDPYLVATLGKQNIKGIQEQNVISTVKHFAVYGIPVGGRDGNVRTDPHVAPREMWNLYLEPFRVAVQEAGAKGVMASYNDYDGVPIIASRYFLTDILRNQFGFKGYVVSDSHALEDLFAKHKVARDTADAARLALYAGMNVRTEFKNPADYIRGLRRGISEGSIPMDIVDQRVREVLRVKFEIGLFDHPYVADPKQADRLVHNQEAKDLALQAAHEGIVLLENKNNVLPIKKDIASIALIGPNVKERHSLLSRYGPNPTNVITVYEGLQQGVSADTKINYALGCKHIDPHFPQSDIQEFELNAEELKLMEEAVEVARRSELVILAMGDNEQTIGETKSRSNLRLPGRQELLVKKVLALNKPTILLLVGGRPVTFGFDTQKLQGLLATWYLGEYMGQAIADVLFGKYNPAGRLSMPFPKSIGQIPLSFPFKPGANATGTEDAHISGFSYPFGFGLSYTQFRYSDLKIDQSKFGAEGKLSVSFKIKNTGSVDGDEVPQLYFNDEVSSVTTYVKNLRGFERVFCKAGEEKVVQMVLTAHDLSLLNLDMKRVVEPGWFNFMVGSSSEDIRLQQRIKL